MIAWGKSAPERTLDPACMHYLNIAREAPISDRTEGYRDFRDHCRQKPRVAAKDLKEADDWIRDHPTPKPNPEGRTPANPRDPVRVEAPVPPLQPFQPVQTAAPPAAEPPRTVLSDSVTVDRGGEAEFKTITDALPQVRDGGTITIRKGEYRENLIVARPVTLIGEPDFGTVIIGSIQSTAKDVTLQRLSLKGRESAGTLRVEGGSVRFLNGRVENDGGIARDGIRTAAAVISAGTLEITGGTIGPGRDAAILISGGELWVRHAEIKGDDGLGIFATRDSIINIAESSKISGETAIITNDEVNLTLKGSILTGSRDEPVIVLNEETHAEIRDNKVTLDLGNRLPGSAGRDWILAAATVNYCMENNRSGKKRLPKLDCETRRPRNRAHRPN